MCGRKFLTMKSTKYNNGSTSHQIPRTKYLKYTLLLTLEEMFNGTTRQLGVNKNVVCDVCQGTGSENEITEDYATCEECHGLGVRSVVVRSNTGIVEQIERDCELCWGKGEAIIVEDRCSNCQGRKTVPDQQILNVRVKRGSRHGQKIIYKDEGTQEPNLRPGDVIVILEALDHHTFKRQGDDLVLTMPLEMVEALCGFEKMITTLDKRHLVIRSPVGKVVKDNEFKFLPGQGMPLYENPNERGKLIIHFEVNFPTSIRSRHVSTIEQCLPNAEPTDIPMDAQEANLMDIPDEDYNDQGNYENNGEEYNEDQNYDHMDYEANEQYDDNGLPHQYGSDEQYEQGQYYPDDCYEVDENYENANGYDYHQQSQYYHQEVFGQGDDESLESYDATQQYRFHE